ncbi:MAG: redoxin domain-containing protein [Calditrichaceae bacterium]|jgi:alkyl hydroperoxide reductase subunit AhpC
MSKFIILLSILFLLPFAVFSGVGDKAPDFTLDKLGGGEFTLSDYSGKVIFIFWFGYT